MAIDWQLKTLGLCRNILRAIAAADLPPLESFPLAQQVTFKYYTGVLAFLGEDYSKVCNNLWANRIAKTFPD